MKAFNNDCSVLFIVSTQRLRVQSELVITYCCQFVKLPKEFVEQLNQFLSGALRGQAGESHDVCKQDAVERREEKRS